MPVRFYNKYSLKLKLLLSSAIQCLCISCIQPTHTLITFWFGLDVISTVLCQKGLSDIFGHFVLFMDYDTTANNTSVKFLEASCAWK